MSSMSLGMFDIFVTVRTKRPSFSSAVTLRKNRPFRYLEIWKESHYGIGKVMEM